MPAKKLKASAPSPTPQNLKAESLAPQASALTTLFGEKHGGRFSFAHLASRAPTPSPSPAGFAAGSSRTPYAPPATFPHLAAASPLSVPFAPVTPASSLASILPPIDLAASYLAASYLAATDPPRVHLAQALVVQASRASRVSLSSATLSARTVGTSCSTSWNSGSG